MSFPDCFDKLTETLTQFGTALDPDAIPEVSLALDYSFSDICASTWKGAVTLKGMTSVGDDGVKTYAYTRSWRGEGPSVVLLVEALRQEVGESILTESSLMQRKSERLAESARLAGASFQRRAARYVAPFTAPLPPIEEAKSEATSLSALWSSRDPERSPLDTFAEETSSSQ